LHLPLCCFQAAASSLRLFADAAALERTGCTCLVADSLLPLLRTNISCQTTAMETIGMFRAASGCGMG